MRTALTVLAPALVYLLVRQLSVAILWIMARGQDTAARNALTYWDGQWYLGIAAFGYREAPDWLLDARGERLSETPLAFFPGYPVLSGWLAELPGVNLSTAAFGVTVGSGLVAAYGISRIGMLIKGGSRRAGLVLVALFAASPMAVVLSMTYSEALFCALAAWTLVFVLRANQSHDTGRYWVFAGVLCALAGLVRSTGLALVVSVVFAAAVFIVRGRTGERVRLYALLAALLAPTGLLGYLWWAGAQIRPNSGFFGQIGGWGQLQREGWDTWFDGGAATLNYVGNTLAHTQSTFEIGTVVALLASIALLALCVVRKVEWPLVVYALGVVVLVLGSNGVMTSKTRLLLPAFVLLIPVALGLAKRKTPTVVVTLTCVLAVSAWFGAHSLVVWPYAI